MLTLGFPENSQLARDLARLAGSDYAEVGLHRFPDGESQLTLPPRLPARVAVYRSLDRPNDKLIELLLLAGAAREAGVRHLTLLAPYLCYMRQDTAFHPGEVVSQRHIGRLLAQHFDALITVDPHLHRTAELGQAVPLASAVTLHATGPIGEFLHQQMHNALLIGPDAESRQWVEAIAAPLGWDYGVAHKERRGDRTVEVTLPPLALSGRAVVLVDDMVSTGHTLAAAARLCRQRGAASVDCVVTHALFTPEAGPLLADAGIGHVWSSDAVAHPSNAIALAPLLAPALRALGG